MRSELEFTKFYNLGEIPNYKLKFAVIVAKHKGELVFVRHKDRDTYEIPGGTREPKEPINKTAHRELIEETGAKKFSIKPICVYGIRKKKYEYFGKLYIAEIFEFGELPEMEIVEVIKTNTIPSNLTYPKIQPYILEKINEL